MSLKARNRLVLLALTGLVAAAMAGPSLYIKAKGKSITERDAPLTGSQVQRGPYMNTGSRDIGADPVRTTRPGNGVMRLVFGNQPPRGPLLRSSLYRYSTSTGSPTKRLAAWVCVAGMGHADGHIPWKKMTGIGIRRTSGGRLPVARGGTMILEYSSTSK